MEKKFGYVIKVDGREVWHGLNPKQKFNEIKSQNIGKQVSSLTLLRRAGYLVM